MWSKPSLFAITVPRPPTFTSASAPQRLYNTHCMHADLIGDPRCVNARRPKDVDRQCSCPVGRPRSVDVETSRPRPETVFDVDRSGMRGAISATHRRYSDEPFCTYSIRFLLIFADVFVFI